MAKKEDTMKNHTGGSILLWTCLTVVFFHMVLFLISCSMLLNQAKSINSTFTEGAIQDHGVYLFFGTLALLRGYLLVSICYVIVLFPIIKLWIGDKEPRKFSVIWRALLLMLLSILALFLRMMIFKPYFVAQWMPEWQFEIMPNAPGELKTITLWTLLNGIPIIIISAVILFWLKHLSNQLKLLLTFKIKMRYYLIGASAILLFWASSNLLKLTFPSETERPNVIIIASDSLRPDHLSCNGYPRNTSPNIDALEAKSINFTKCFTPIGSTLESMIGLMSSQYPHTHGVRHMFPSKNDVLKVNQESPKLPKILKNSGYETAVIGDWCSAIFNEVPMGFENIQVSEFDSFRIWLSQALYLSHPVIPMYFDNKFGYWLFPKLESFAHYLRAEVVTDRAINKIKNRKNKTKPFFYTIFTGCNHFAYHAPYPYYEKWTDPKYQGPNKYQVHFDPNEFISSSTWDEKFFSYSDKEKQHIIDLYDGCVSRFDDCVGRIIKTLESENLMDNTIVLITSDHGEDLFEPYTSLTHGVSFNGGDQGNLVPCILYVPKTEPRKINHIIRNIDLAPTLLKLTVNKTESRFEGTNLSPYIEGETSDLNLAFYGETSFPFVQRRTKSDIPLYVPPLDELTYVDKNFKFHIVLKPEHEKNLIKSKERCLRTKSWKIVFSPTKNGYIHSLYNIENDPQCLKDVSNEFPNIMKRMKHFLWEWILHGKEYSNDQIMNDPLHTVNQVPSDYKNIKFPQSETISPL